MAVARASIAATRQQRHTGSRQFYENGHPEWTHIMIVRLITFEIRAVFARGWWYALEFSHY